MRNIPFHRHEGDKNMVLPKLSGAAKVVALLLFLLPWITVSCSGQTLITMSGLDLARGVVSMHNPMTGATESPPGTNGGDMFVIAGAVLILISLAIGFLIRGRTGALAAIASAIAAAASLAYTVLVRIPGKAHDTPAMPGGGAPSGMSAEQLAAMIQVNVQIGFWLVMLALVAAIVLDFMAMSGSAAAAPPAAAPPPV
jgi:hypothetical protein